MQVLTAIMTGSLDTIPYIKNAFFTLLPLFFDTILHLWVPKGWVIVVEKYVCKYLYLQILTGR